MLSVTFCIASEITEPLSFSCSLFLFLPIFLSLFALSRSLLPYFLPLTLTPSPFPFPSPIWYLTYTGHVTSAYGEFAFHRGLQHLLNLSHGDLSSFFYEVSKVMDNALLGPPLNYTHNHVPSFIYWFYGSPHFLRVANVNGAHIDSTTLSAAMPPLQL